ncbi:hypothetical protein JCM15765_02340 [Paradesulfitobacterium aromaticivorans]
MSKNLSEISEVQDYVTPAPDWSNERTLLHRLIREEGTLVGEVAKAIGKSHSVVSLYINGKYKASAGLETLVRNYLIKMGKWQDGNATLEVAAAVETPAGTYPFPPMPHVEAKKGLGQIGMIKTEDMARVWGICRKSYENCEFGMIIGKPGTGKSYALENLRNMGSMPMEIITCDETSTIKSILVDTAEALNLEIKGTSAVLMRRIVKELKRRSILLVYDEADLLRGPKVFETLRAIYDKTQNIGVVLCGNQNLAERILSFAEDRPEMARIRDRIGYFQRLSGLTKEEAIRFLDGINCTPRAAELLVNIALKRGIRQLVKGLGRLLEVTQGETITEELVEELGQIVLSFNA